MPYETVRQQIASLARLHRQLQHRYATHAALNEGRKADLLQILARQEARLAAGLEETAARRDDRALDTWVQFPSRPAPLPPLDDSSLGAIAGSAAASDVAVAAVYRPLCQLGARRIRELCAGVQADLASRARARARIATFDLA